MLGSAKCVEETASRNVAMSLSKEASVRTVLGLFLLRLAKFPPDKPHPGHQVAKR